MLKKGARYRCCRRAAVVLSMSLVIFSVLDMEAQTDAFAAPRTEPKEQTDFPDVPADMKFEPAWRNKGDCGPVSLFVLMRLSCLSRNWNFPSRPLA